MAKHEGLLKKFKLTTTISTSNMHLFDSKGVIKKYDTPEQSRQNNDNKLFILLFVFDVIHFINHFNDFLFYFILFSFCSSGGLLPFKA